MNATIQFTCPQCSHTMQLPASVVGQTGKCAKCGTVVTVSSDENLSPAENVPATATPAEAPQLPQSFAIDTSPKIALSESGRETRVNEVQDLLDCDEKNLSWGALSNGEKVIFVSGCLAVLSMFLPWWQIGVFSVTGIDRGTPLLSLCLGFLYPAIMLFQRQSIDIRISITLAMIALLGALYTIWSLSNSSGPFGGKVDLYGSGTVCFVLACIGAILGQVICYREAKASSRPNRSTSPVGRQAGTKKTGKGRSKIGHKKGRMRSQIQRRKK